SRKILAYLLSIPTRRSSDLNGEYENVANALIRFTNIGQLHKGIEIDGKWRPLNTLMFRGYFTLGDWQYDGSSPVYVIDEIDNSPDRKSTRLNSSHVKISYAV